LKNNTIFEPFKYEAELLNDSEKKLRVIRKSRQVGITTTIAHEVVWKGILFSNKLILIISPSDRQSQIVMTKIHAIIDSNEELKKEIIKRNLSEIIFSNNSKIFSLPNNPDRFRGFAATDIYLDEAAHFLNDEPVWAVIKPMLIATKGTLTIISTPFGKRGLFFEQYQYAVNQKGLDPEVKFYDFFPSTISPLINDVDLEKEKKNMTDLEFQQEYLGEFVEAVDTYIPMELIEPCVDPSLELMEEGEEGTRYFVGIDFAKQRDESVVYFIERRDDVLVTRHIQAWTKMNYSEQIGRLRELTKKFLIAGGCADQTGVGEAVIEDVQAIIPNIEGINFTIQTKVDLAGHLRTLFEQKRIRIPNDRKLITQINSLYYEVSKAGNVLFKSPEKATLHDDYLWALALACYSARMVDTSKPILRSIQ